MNDNHDDDDDHKDELLPKPRKKQLIILYQTEDITQSQINDICKYQKRIRSPINIIV